MFETRNSYVLNKYDADAIVYEDANGTRTRLTSEYFGSDEEFRRFKEWSDEDYHRTEKERRLYLARTTALEMTPQNLVITDSAEDSFLGCQQDESREKLLSELETGMVKCLTSTQRRRILLFFAEGLKESAIAEIEGVKQPSICECLAASKKKLKKYLKKTLYKRGF